MLPTLLQSKVVNVASNGASVDVTFDNPVQAGSLIFIVYAQFGAGDPTFFNVFDDAQNIYESIGNTTSTTTPNTFINLWYSITGIVGATTASFAVHFSNFGFTGNGMTFIALEYTNFPAGFTWPTFSNPLKTFDVNNGGVGTTITTNTNGTTPLPGANIILGVAANTGNQTFTVTSPETDTIQTTNGTNQVVVSDLMQNVVAIQDFTATLPSSANWVSGLICLSINNPARLTKGNILKASSATSSVGVTLGIAPAVGDLLYASVYASAGTPTISGFTSLGTQTIHGTKSVTVLVKNASGSETTITAASAGATAMRLHVYDFFGIGNPYVIDGGPVGNTSPDNTHTSFLTSSITPVNTRILLIGSFASTGAVPLNNQGQTMSNLQIDDLLLDVVDFPQIVLGTITFQPTVTSNDYIGSIFMAFDSAPPIPDPLIGSLTTVNAGS